METAKKSKKSKSSRLTAESITKAYRKTLLSEGKRPVSVYKFCQDNGITEPEFYSFFGSFSALEKALWGNYATAAIKSLTGDSNYADFSAREKILSFNFALVELLKEDRSFVLFQAKDWRNHGLLPSFLKTFRQQFDVWINEVINAGKQNGEIATRPYLDTQYDNLFWLNLMFILQFWMHDESANFEKTDAAIEKSVNLAFDLVGKGVLDKALDFGKFLYQQSKN